MTKLQNVVDAVGEVVYGKAPVVRLLLTALLAEGHVLLEDVPGIGKTALARAFTSAVGGRFSRIQLTADLLPADITGTMIRDADSGGWVFRPGPLFGDVVLADELNRTPPRTQSALFEAMAEGQVTVDGTTHALPGHFFVIATQNPSEQRGTFELPESQLDRFLLKTAVGYPSREDERRALRRAETPTVPSILTADDIRASRNRVDEVTLPAAVEDQLLDLVHATRTDHRLLQGVSIRGARALHRAVRAWAVVHGRDYVAPDDLHHLAEPVLGHRVIGRRLGTESAVVIDLLGR